MNSTAIMFVYYFYTQAMTVTLLTKVTQVNKKEGFSLQGYIFLQIYTQFSVLYEFSDLSKAIKDMTVARGL